LGLCSNSQSLVVSRQQRVCHARNDAGSAVMQQVLRTWEDKAKLLGLSAQDRADLKDCLQV